MMKSIVFDLDGTLVDSAPDITRALNRMLEERGLPPQPVDLVETLIGEGAPMLVRRLYEAMGVESDDAVIERDVTAYLGHYRRRPVQDSRLFADAASAVPALHAAGYRLGVCTNKGQLLAECVLEHFGLRPYFAAVVGADSTAFRKPDPGHLLATLDRMGTTPEQAVYVGDTVIDRDCAAAAAVPCWIVNWGTGPSVAVEAARRLNRFADLLPRAAATA